ncbi:3-oxo-5-alpha-steroid 4-dehydrogenase [Onchocerca flexuosa]|uniref:3-oxo-5alpha-steroid 4-dehydrogenase (NADP(+)) n=1 Tax=Onchocerca flexuosa TaxID=387005 RepID=A0A238C5E1_9BILA|nr:3-oxo-5-alpha-steroid 4-dehydrogenase [Onchocerca flexuosa]
MDTMIEMLSYGMLVSGIIVFLILTFGFEAPYGRYFQKSHPSIPLISAKWAWFIQEIPSFCIPLHYLITGFIDLPLINTFILILFILHYINRALIYPFLIKGDTKTPVHILLLSLLFCTVNGYMQGIWHSHNAVYNRSLKDIVFCFVGTLIFLSGMMINITSDSILRNLRKDGESGYKIPYGGLFKYISGANFFGECVEWTGYALLAQTLPAFAFAFFTLCNLAPRAYHHHRWYQEKFDNYPKDRKAFIPFVI